LWAKQAKCWGFRGWNPPRRETGAGISRERLNFNPNPNNYCTD